jgi:hypothetical protein
MQSVIEVSIHDAKIALFTSGAWDCRGSGNKAVGFDYLRGSACHRFRFSAREEVV